MTDMPRDRLAWVEISAFKPSRATKFCSAVLETRLAEDRPRTSLGIGWHGR